MNFTVDEEKQVIVNTQWYSEEEAEIEIPEEEENPAAPGGDGEVAPAPVFEVNVDEDDVTEIPEEPVPLADAPKTGSDAIIWLALAIFAALGMAAARFTGKKRQHETF